MRRRGGIVVGQPSAELLVSGHRSGRDQGPGPCGKNGADSFRDNAQHVHSPVTNSTGYSLYRRARGVALSLVPRGHPCDP